MSLQNPSIQLKLGFLDINPLEMFANKCSLDPIYIYNFFKIDGGRRGGNVKYSDQSKMSQHTVGRGMLMASCTSVYFLAYFQSSDSVILFHWHLSKWGLIRFNKLSFCD